MIATAQPRSRPLSVMFTITSMNYGGAETLLANLLRRLARDRFAPEVCCIKQPGTLGEELAKELPVHAFGLRCKYDVRVWGWLTRGPEAPENPGVLSCSAGRVRLK